MQLIRARFDALESESAALRAHLASLESKLGVTGTEEHVATAERAAAKARQHTHAMQKAAAGVAPVLAGEEEPQSPQALPSDAGTQTELPAAMPAGTAPADHSQSAHSALRPNWAPTSSGASPASEPTPPATSEAAAAEALDAAAAAAAARVEALQQRYDAMKSEAEKHRGSWGMLSPIVSLPGQLWRLVSSGDTAGPVKGDVAAIWRGVPEHRVRRPAGDPTEDSGDENQR